jgi:phosphoribosylformylglycinamidine cyclo-ligase
MPGLYQPGNYDLAGTIIGIVEEDEALHGDAVRPGDRLLAYASTGLHTNGYTLARKILFDTLKLQPGDRLADTGASVGDALLAVHRSYARAVMPVIKRVHGLAHITGGGIPGNLVRILPSNVDAVVDSGSWTLPPLFKFMQDAGRVSIEEMRDVFNLGVGLIAALPADAVTAAEEAAARDGIATWVLGEIRSGTGTVQFSP